MITLESQHVNQESSTRRRQSARGRPPRIIIRHICVVECQGIKKHQLTSFQKLCMFSVVIYLKQSPRIKAERKTTTYLLILGNAVSNRRVSKLSWVAGCGSLESISPEAVVASD